MAPTAELREAIHDLNPAVLTEKYRELMDELRICRLADGLKLVNTGRPYQMPTIKFTVDSNQMPKIESVVEEDGLREFAWQVNSWMLRPLLRREIIETQEFCLVRQKILGKDPWFWAAELKALDVRQNPKNISHWYLNSAELTSYSYNHAGKVVRGEARSQLVRLALACKAYHNDQGVWPGALAVLAPKYLAVIPPNPAFGKPFIYRPRPNGFTLATDADAPTSTTQGGGGMTWIEGE
jgi:hypothetical protein